MPHRIAYIDRMKGFTILLVVIGHLYLFGVNIRDCIPNLFIGACHMHLFMFLSGYVAYISPNAASSNAISLERKIIRRILSYIVPCFMVVWIAALYNTYVRETPNTYLQSLIMYGGYWYLKSLTIYTVMLYVITRIRKTWINILLLALSFAMFYVGWRTSPLLNEIFCLEHAVCFSPFFFMGYYFRKYDLLSWATRSEWIFTLSLIGFVVLLFTELPIHGLQVLSRQYVRPTLAILFLTYLFAQRADKNSKIEKWLEWLGTKTLDIYLYHGFFLMSAGFGIVNLSELSSWTLATNNHLACLLIIIVISVVLSYISIWIGQLLRCSKHLRMIIYGQLS